MPQHIFFLLFSIKKCIFSPQNQLCHYVDINYKGFTLALISCLYVSIKDRNVSG